MSRRYATAGPPADVLHHIHDGDDLIVPLANGEPVSVLDAVEAVSINATTEVDLVGQCASETVTGRYWSSSGGQADFARGAMYSRDGKAFVVLPSTAADGEISRIRATLTPGSMVTTSKNTVDHIVTEYGVAKMRGRSSQRAGR